VFRRGGDVSFVVEELKAIVDPQGGSWLNGQYVPSLIAAIGGVIETHLKRIDALSRERVHGEAQVAEHPPVRRAKKPPDHLNEAGICPRCSSPAYQMREGCWVCATCGHSSCG
jgi:ribonucleoside-diphosphate reductase alpha chain